MKFYVTFNDFKYKLKNVKAYINTWVNNTNKFNIKSTHNNNIYSKLSIFSKDDNNNNIK